MITRYNLCILFFLFCTLLPAQNWKSSKLNIPNRIVHATVSTLNGLYILEGRLMKGGRSDELIVLNRKNNTHTSKAPNARDGHSLSVDKNGNLLSFGGNSSKGILNELWKYENEKWKLIKPNNGISPPKRWGHGAVYFKNKLWVFGGKAEGRGQFHQDLWSWDGKAWKKYESPVKPEARYGTQLGIYNNKLVLYGGRNHSRDWFTDTWVWNDGWKTVQQQKNKPGTSVGFALITTKHDLYLIGGILKGDSFNQMWKFKGKDWELVQDNLPFQLDFPAGCYDADKNSLLVSGSHKGDFELWEYKLKD